MKSLILLLALVLVACVGTGCACGTAPTSMPVLDINLPSASVPPPLWIHGEPTKPQFIPSGYVQAVESTMTVPVTRYVPVPQQAPAACAPQAPAPAWTPVAPAAPPCP